MKYYKKTNTNSTNLMEFIYICSKFLKMLLTDSISFIGLKPCNYCCNCLWA